MKNKPIAYSRVLIEFIEPLLDGTEDEDEFLTKARMGMIAWNYHVSDQNKLPYDDTMKAILQQMTDENEEGKEILNALVLRKELHFSNYNQFLFKVETRTKPNGDTVLRVESGPVDKIF